MAAGDPITEIHIVNGLHPGLPFDYYTELLAGLKRIQPGIHLKAFTAVEIFYFAKKFGMSIEDGAAGAARRRARFAARRRRRDLRAARAQEDLRRQVRRRRVARGPPRRAPDGAALELHDALRHIETVEERVDHLLRLRALQDETGGFQTFIPLAFHPENNALMKLPGPTGVEDLRTYAVARLLLDNIPHIKAYWIMLGVKTAQTALWFGADDLDGTVQEERIYHMAGADDAAGDEPGRDRAHHPRTPAARRSSATRSTTSSPRGRRSSPTSRSGATSAAAWRSCRERAQAGCQDPLSAVSFLNARPITYGLEQALGAVDDRFELSFDLPSRCAERLERGDVDLGLIPVGAYAAMRRASCASSPASPSPATAPVRTVLLVGEVPWAEMKEIALDGASRSSAMLLKLLCHERRPHARASARWRTTRCSPPRTAPPARWSSATPASPPPSGFRTCTISARPGAS